jgi:hypothetical protein
MKRNIPDSKKVDISQLGQSDRVVVYDHLDRVEQFAIDIATIRGPDAVEANKLVADNLVKSFKSRQAAVFAESEIIAQRVRRGNVKLLEISSISTDAYYIQEKIGGIYVRLEIKSVTQATAAAVDKEIINAEAQHRDRLHDEKGKPTWHKTTIVIGNDNNPWPCRNMNDFELFKENPEQLQAIAEHRLQKLVMGSIKPSKELERQPSRVIMRQLREADSVQTNLEQLLLPEGNEKLLAVTSNVVTTPLKRPLPPDPPATPDKVQLSGHKAKFLASPYSDASTPKRPLPPGPSSHAALPATKQPMQLRFGRTARAVSKITPNSPISQRLISRKQELKALAEENIKLSVETRIKRRLLVTEQVTVICPHLNLTFVLNRGADKFVARVKGVAKPLGQAKRERKHWDVPAAFRKHWRDSANQEGNTPLHLAVKELKEDLVKFYIKNRLMDVANNEGDFPIHVAITMGNKDIVKLIAMGTNKIDVHNKDGLTALQLAHSHGNTEIVKILIQSGASKDVPSEKKEHHEKE